jgi:hypothetical protein
MRLVAPYLAEGRLHHRTRAPEFRLPAHAVYPDEQDAPAIGLALGAMRKVAGACGGAGQ